MSEYPRRRGRENQRHAAAGPAVGLGGACFLQAQRISFNPSSAKGGIPWPKLNLLKRSPKPRTRSKWTNTLQG